MADRPVDMSSAAVARRLEAMNELRNLGLSLRAAGRAAARAQRK